VASQMSADVKAKCARLDKLAVKAAQPEPVEGFPQVNQLGAQQPEAAFQVIHLEETILPK
jgi:hypothetical protein